MVMGLELIPKSYFHYGYDLDSDSDSTKKWNQYTSSAVELVQHFDVKGLLSKQIHICQKVKG